MFGLKGPNLNPNLLIINKNLKFILSKILSKIFIVATLLLNHISGPIIHVFPILSLIFNFFFFLISQITFSLLSTLISLFLYPFIFHYFWFFLFPSSYYKFTIFSPILCIVFLHTKSFFFLSLSLSLSIFPFFWFFFF